MIRKGGEMARRRTAARIALPLLLIAAGGLALGAEQFSALAQRLEAALQDEAPDAPSSEDVEAEDAETEAERAEDDGYPLGRAAPGGR
jgi:hypothetical protein